MSFEHLQAKLVSHLRTRVRNGEISERRIAIMTGISQPHIHNVLKGTRVLSPGSADLILLHLHISMRELLDAAAGEIQTEPLRQVPVLQGCIAPRCVYPTSFGNQHQLLAASQAAKAIEPVVALVEGDPEMAPGFDEDEYVLLDQSELARSVLEADAYYAVSFDNGSAIRMLRRGMGCIYILTNRNREQTTAWKTIQLGHMHPLQIIRARVLCFKGAPEGWPREATPESGVTLSEPPPYTFPKPGWRCGPS